ncbi:hypothetical protein FMM75_03325 [Lachnospiraceae bacterium MD335]|nr:hypothetical protein [Lachnospiraceae bacterium MD335]
MGKVVCEKCGTEFKFEIVKNFESCPVCGASFSDDGDSANVDEHSDWINWYYYGYKSDNGKTGSLRDKAIDLDKHGDVFFLIKEFKAPPRDAAGSSEKAKEILRTYVPDAFEKTREVPKVQCPYCHSTEIQLVPKKFSLLTGFATNGYNRVCVRCQRKF